MGKYSEIINNQQLMELVPFTAVRIDNLDEYHGLMQLLDESVNHFKVIPAEFVIGSCYVLDFPDNTCDSQDYLLSHGYNIISYPKFKRHVYLNSLD